MVDWIQKKYNFKSKYKDHETVIMGYNLIPKTKLQSLQGIHFLK